jgi:hypothetical protein
MGIGSKDPQYLQYTSNVCIKMQKTAEAAIKVRDSDLMSNQPKTVKMHDK